MISIRNSKKSTCIVIIILLLSGLLASSCTNHDRFSASFTDDFIGWQMISIPFEDFNRSAEQPANAPNDGLDLTQMFGFSIELPASEGDYYLDQIQLSK